MSAVPVHLKIRDSARPPVPTELAVTPLSAGERFGRSAVAVMVGLIAAVVLAFVPLVHLVAVPAVIIVTGIIAWQLSRKTVRVTASQLGCPKCSSPVPVPAGSLGWPATLDCPTCGATVRASPWEPRPSTGLHE